MAFLDSLDEEGKQLYSDYIKYRNKWIDYVRPKALKKLNDYLNSNNKDFDKYEYLNINIADICSDKKKSSKENTAKYKKLSLLFHPDKFNKPQELSTAFFALINKFHSANNDTLINTIDTISHLILEIDNLDSLDYLKNIIRNLNNPDITNILKKKLKTKMADKTEANVAYDIFEILISSNPLNDNANDKPEPLNNSIYEEFIDSIMYSFYKDKQSSIDYINDKFITEAQLIEKIEKHSVFNTDFIIFCAQRYRDNKNIMVAIHKLGEQLKDKLIKENAKMREQINNLKTY